MSLTRLFLLTWFCKSGAGSPQPWRTPSYPIDCWKCCDPSDLPAIYVALEEDLGRRAAPSDAQANSFSVCELVGIHLRVCFRTSLCHLERGNARNCLPASRSALLQPFVAVEAVSSEELCSGHGLEHRSSMLRSEGCGGNANGPLEKGWRQQTTPELRLPLQLLCGESRGEHLFRGWPKDFQRGRGNLDKLLTFIHSLFLHPIHLTILQPLSIHSHRNAPTPTPHLIPRPRLHHVCDPCNRQPRAQQHITQRDAATQRHHAPLQPQVAAPKQQIDCDAQRPVQRCHGPPDQGVRHGWRSEGL